MSWKATAAIKDLNEGVSRSEKLLLLILADYHNDKTGQCNPKVKDIAEDALMGVRRVQQLLSGLHNRGVIIIKDREGGTKRAQYWLACIGYTPEKYAPLEGEEISPLPPKPVAPQGRSQLHPSGEIPHAALYEVTAIEPQEKPQLLVAESDHPFVSLRSALENTIGSMPGHIYQEAKSYAEIVPGDWYAQAIEEVKKAERPSWAYLKAILDRCLAANQPPRRPERKSVAAPGTAREQVLARIAAAKGVTP